MSPEKACRAAVERISEKHGGKADFQVGYIAVNKKGETGAFSLANGFSYALARDGKNELLTAEHI
jgi:isoaspartyl peptidase/L-asparaginase-like protein (Ntn-hydrolase superfamily)